MSACPVCSGPCLLGTLGNRAHFRCRACGADCSRGVEPDDDVYVAEIKRYATKVAS